MSEQTAVILSAATDSGWAPTGGVGERAEYAVVSVTSPTGFTANTGTIEWSFDGTTAVAATDCLGTALIITLGANKMTMLKPSEWCSVAPFYRLKLTNAAGADSSFRINFRCVE